MRDESTIERLRTVPICSGLDDAMLWKIAEAAAPFEAEPGRVIAEHGQPGSGMFLLTEGAVEVQLPSGRTIALGPGEVVGELSVLADVERVARVRATEPVRGLAISRAALRDLLDAEPRIAVAMLPVLARRLAEVESGPA
jgi:CRP/FNR family transcriptional regulator, cyclic AMP receptor protein